MQVLQADGRRGSGGDGGLLESRQPRQMVSMYDLISAQNINRATSQLRARQQQLNQIAVDLLAEAASKLASSHQEQSPAFIAGGSNLHASLARDQ